jgi:hypothetical protein
MFCRWDLIFKDLLNLFFQFEPFLAWISSYRNDLLGFVFLRVPAQIAVDGMDTSSWPGSRPIARIAAGGADETPWPRLRLVARSQPVARITDEYRDGIRARMTVDGGGSYLTEHNRSACRLVDHFRTTSITHGSEHTIYIKQYKSLTRISYKSSILGYRMACRGA